MMLRVVNIRQGLYLANCVTAAKKFLSYHINLIINYILLCWFSIFLLGLSQCRLNEGLLTKAIKQQEKLHDVQAARGMLSVLRHESIERVWKVDLSGRV